jgi:hypothetical protein
VRFDTTAEAYKAFEDGRGASVNEHGQWSVPASDYKGIVDRFNGMGLTYDWGSTNSNYFAHWFSTQASIPMTVNPAGLWALPGPWLYQWNYSPPNK